MKTQTRGSIEENNTRHTPHTVVIAGDDKGGVTKSCSCAAVADALQALGYTLRFADGDTVNRTFALMKRNAIRIDGRSESDLNDFIGRSDTATEDITLIDMPGSSGDMLKHYFSITGFDAFAEIGLRIVVAITLTQTPDSVNGAKAWIKTFMDEAEFIVFANHRDTPVGQPFTLDHIKSGPAIISMACGRIIEIPRWSDYMKKQFFACQSSPTSYLQGGAAAQKLNLNLLSSAPWRVFHNRITTSVANVAEWLTGKPIPIPAPDFPEGKVVSREKAALLEELSRELGEE